MEVQTLKGCNIVIKITTFYKQFFLQNKSWFLVSALWFFICTLLGVVAFLVYPDFLTIIIQVLRDKVGDESGFRLVQVIFTTNVIASMLALIGGIIVGLPSLIVLTTNGLLLGYVTCAVLYGDTITPIVTKVLFLIATIVPHGIIELPAIIFAASIGLRLGLSWVGGEAKNGSGWVTFKRDIRNAGYAMPVIIVSLLIAALLEVFVTGNLVHFFDK